MLLGMLLLSPLRVVHDLVEIFFMLPPSFVFRVGVRVTYRGRRLLHLGCGHNVRHGASLVMPRCILGYIYDLMRNLCLEHIPLLWWVPTLLWPCFGPGALGTRAALVCSLNHR